MHSLTEPDASFAGPLTVSELNKLIREIIESRLSQVWVVGEVANFRAHSSGHLYFALKDKASQIPAVMFRSSAQRLPFRPEDGLEVIVRGRVGLYDVRGTLQVYVDLMEPRGLGSAQLALEQLRQKLEGEGLFAAERKRPLPSFPNTVGIVTALGGAALHDMLVVLRQRMPCLNVVIRPVRVQGKEAPEEIVEALADLASLGTAEVIIVGRGGGSAEDLSAFNDERVARAVARCQIPVVSAVGHEIDTTIADLVADRRAPTPTAAAAMVVPDAREILEQLAADYQALRQALLRILRSRRELVTSQANRLRNPRQNLANLRLRLDELAERAARAARSLHDREKRSLAAHAQQLHSLSPLAVLQRGFSLTTRADDGRIVQDSSTLEINDELRIRFARGEAHVGVRSISTDSRDTGTSHDHE